MRIRQAFVLLFFASTVQGQTLRIGLAEDPDILDPTMARTFVGRIVFAGLCDKLFDLDEKLNIVPQLATSYEWAADNKSLAYLMGHSSVVITKDRYGHMTDEALTEAKRLLDGYYERALTDQRDHLA